MEPQRPQSTRRRDLSLLVQSSFASVSSVPSVANAFVGIPKNETATTGSHRAHREHREKLGMSLFLEPKSFSVSSVLSVDNAFVGVPECGLNGNGNDLATEHTEITEKGPKAETKMEPQRPQSTRRAARMLSSLKPSCFSVSSVISVVRSLDLGSTWRRRPVNRYSTSIPPLRDPRTTRTWSAYHRYATPSQPGVAAESTWGGTGANLAWKPGQLGSTSEPTWVRGQGRQGVFYRPPGGPRIGR